MERPFQIKFAFLILACIILLVGCGRKGMPVPPGTIRPTAVKDLSYRIMPNGVELSWTVPIRNRDGSPVESIKGFDLFKAEGPVDETCEGCPPQFGHPIEVPFEARPEEARKMYYEDRTLSPGTRYIYEVRTVKGWLNISDPSNRVSFAWHVPPTAPPRLTAQPTPDGIYISWLPAATWADETPVDRHLSYRIYRTKTGEDDWKPIHELVDSNGFFDETAKKGDQYSYKVSAVLIYHGTEIEGPQSQEVTAQPRDLTPPRAPEGLVAVYHHALGKEAYGVELLWQESSEPDLAGYLVYRRDKDGLVDKLNHVPVAISRFIDKTRLPSGTYEYWVTAVDQAKPPNESPPSKPASVEILY